MKNNNEEIERKKKNDKIIRNLKRGRGSIYDGSGSASRSSGFKKIEKDKEYLEKLFGSSESYKPE